MSERTNPEQAGTTATVKAIARPERCPECGRYTDERSTPAPRANRWMRVVIPIATVVLSLAIFVVWLLRTSETNMIGSGTQVARYADPAFTFAEVRGIAEGQPRSDGASLFDAILRTQAPAGLMRSPGERTLEAGFSNAPGLRESRTSVGWPMPWYHDWRWSMYQDAARKRDPIPIVSDPAQVSVGANTSITPDGKFASRPRWSWNYGSIAFRPLPEETNGVSVWRDFNVLGFLSSLGLAIIVGVSVGAVLAMVRQLAFRKCESPSATRVGVCAAGIAVIIIAITAAIRIERIDWARIPTAGATGNLSRAMPRGLSTQNSTGISERRLSELATAIDRDQQIARAIIAAANPELKDDDALLLTVLMPESTMLMTESTGTSFNRSVGLFAVHDQRFIRRTPEPHARMGPSSFRPGGDRMAYSAGWSWGVDTGLFHLTYSSGNPDDLSRQWVVNLQWLGCVAFAAVLLWFVMRTPCMLFAARVRVRRRMNRCLACGHALGPAPLNT